MTNQSKNLKLQREPSDIWFKIILFPALFLILIAHILTKYFYTPQTWGIHHFFFFPDWILWISSFLVILILIPRIGDLFLKLIKFLYETTEKPFAKIKKRQLFLLISLLSLILFWAFRTKLHLLGDGYWVIYFLSEGHISPSEWLDSIIHLGFFRVLSNIFSRWSLELSYAVLSCVSGALFVFVTLCMVDRLVESRTQKLTILGFLLSSGSMQLFFGYVETYTILKLALLCYIFFSILYLRGGVSFFFPLISLVISILLHLAAIIFLPTLFFLIWEKKIKKKRFKFRLGFILSVILILVSGTILGLRTLHATGTDPVKLILPLHATPDTSFTLFSWAHILELLNQILLISPVGFLVLIFFGFHLLRFREFGEPMVNFLLLGVLLSVCFLLVFNFVLGSTDWDFRSFPTDFFVLLGVLLFIKWGGSWKNFKHYALILIVVSFYHTIPWILINADHTRSVNRYIMIRENDPHPQDENNYNTMPTAMMLEQANLPGEAIKIYENAIRKNPGDPRNYYFLAETHCRQRSFYAALFHLKKGQKLLTNDPSYIRLEGLIYQWTGQREKAIACFESVADSFADDLEFLLNLSVLFYKAGNFEKSETYVRRALALDHNDPQGHFILSKTLLKLNHFSEAEKEESLARKLATENPQMEAALKKLEKFLED